MADIADRVAKRPGVLEPGETVLAAARAYAGGYLKLRVLLWMVAIAAAYVVVQSIDESGSLATSAAAGVVATLVAETVLNLVHRPGEGLTNRMVMAATEDRLLLLATSVWTGYPTELLIGEPFSNIEDVRVVQRRVSFWNFGHVVVSRRDAAALSVETTPRASELLKTIQARF